MGKTDDENTAKARKLVRDMTKRAKIADLDAGATDAGLDPKRIKEEQLRDPWNQS